MLKEYYVGGIHIYDANYTINKFVWQYLALVDNLKEHNIQIWQK